MYYILDHFLFINDKFYKIYSNAGFTKVSKIDKIKK